MCNKTNGHCSSCPTGKQPPLCDTGRLRHVDYVGSQCVKKCQCLFTVLTAAEKTANPTDSDKQLAVKGYRATQSDHD